MSLTKIPRTIVNDEVPISLLIKTKTSKNDRNIQKISKNRKIMNLLQPLRKQVHLPLNEEIVNKKSSPVRKRISPPKSRFKKYLSGWSTDRNSIVTESQDLFMNSKEQS